MNEFLRKFIMDCIKDMIEKGKDLYVIYQYALGWYSKGILDQDDLELIQELYAEKHKQPEVAVTEETEETPEGVEDIDE